MSGAVKSGINGVLGMVEGVVNKFIGMINGCISVINNIPGVNISRLNTLSIPRLAKGGVLYDDTIVRVGEYSGASSNPEIVSPQNIMYDTMRRALEDTEFHSNNGQDIYLTLKVGDEEMAQVVIDKLGNIVRNSGRGLETVMEGGRYYVMEIKTS